MRVLEQFLCPGYALDDRRLAPPEVHDLMAGKVCLSKTVGRHNVHDLVFMPSFATGMCMVSREGTGWRCAPMGTEVTRNMTGPMVGYVMRFLIDPREWTLVYSCEKV